MSVTAIEKELLRLPAIERAQLIDVLWNSISEPQQQARESAWAGESERRIDAFNTGKLAARDATGVIDDLKKRSASVKARFISTAERELTEAIEFYESAQTGLGSEFLAEVEATLKLIESFPLAWGSLSPRTRRCRTHRFPYGLFYQVRDHEILIVSVMDLRRDPDRWEQYL